MKAIQGKQAHFGRHTFKANAEVFEGKKITRLSVYRNYSNKLEATYYFNRKKQLVEMSNDQDSALRFYTGSLSGTHRKNKEGTRVNKNGRIVPATIVEEMPKVDYFLSCFKHNID